jgi:hypothetical protein
MERTYEETLDLVLQGYGGLYRDDSEEHTRLVYDYIRVKFADYALPSHDQQIDLANPAAMPLSGSTSLDKMADFRRQNEYAWGWYELAWRDGLVSSLPYRIRQTEGWREAYSWGGQGEHSLCNRIVKAALSRDYEDFKGRAKELTKVNSR